MAGAGAGYVDRVMGRRARAGGGSEYKQAPGPAEEEVRSQGACPVAQVRWCRCCLGTEVSHAAASSWHCLSCRQRGHAASRRCWRATQVPQAGSDSARVPDTHGCRGWQAQDVLSRLLEYREADADGQQAREGGGETRGRRLSDDEIAAVLGDIMTAGGGSTGDAIATTLWRLACDSSMLARVRAEVDPVLGGSVSAEAGGGDGVPASLFEKVSAKDGGFVFTSALVKEVLRGSAFASVILRLAHQDSLLGVGRADMVQRESVPGGRVGSAASPSVLIPQGSAVVMSPTVLGQDPDNWSNPAAFDPHRFLAPVADASSAASQPQLDAAASTSDIRSEVPA